MQNVQNPIQSMQAPMPNHQIPIQNPQFPFKSQIKSLNMPNSKHLLRVSRYQM